MIRQVSMKQTAIIRSVANSGAGPTINRNATSILNQRAKMHSLNTLQYSVVESAKEALKTANKKVGEFAASGMETVEHVHPVETIANAASAVNKKAGEVLASGMEAAETAKPAETLSKAADAAKDKTAEALKSASKTAENADPKKQATDAAANAKSAAEDAVEGAQSRVKDVKEAAGDVVDSAKQKADEVRQAAENISDPDLSEERNRARENYKGYASLQDKGAKVEEEQNRPDDGI